MNGVSKSRPSKVCLFCKKRKKRCNRENPCQQCLRAKVECIYSGDWNQNDKQNTLKVHKSFAKENLTILNNRAQEIQVYNNLNEGIKNNNNNNNDRNKKLELNIYKEFSSFSINNSRQMHYGPFSWMSIMKSDPLLCVLEEFALDKFFELQKEEKRSQNNIINYPDDTLNVQYFEVERIINNHIKTENETLIFHQLSKEANDSLPSNKTINHLLKIFFTNIYPFLPIIDELKFKQNIDRIISLDDNKEISNRIIKFERKSDIATMGILLMLLRISFCFMYEGNPINCFKDVLNGNSVECASDEEMSKSYKLISTARKCINQFNINRRSNIEVLQLIMLYKIYHRYAPETSDGVDECDADISLSSMIRLAISLGINREPSEFAGFNCDTNTCHLYRKMWYILIIWDVRQSCISGGDLNISPKIYDIEFPHFVNNISNVSKVEYERLAIHILEIQWSHFNPLRNILESLLDIRNKSTVEEILLLLSDFECTILYSPITISLENRESSRAINDRLIRSIKVLNFFEIKCFLMSTYYLLFLYCEKNKLENILHHCQKKLLTNVTNELLVNIYNVLLSDKFFNFLIIPSMESAIQKINLILLSFILRTNYLTREQNLINYELNLKFMNCLKGCVSLCLSFSSLLSSWYCYSLQTVKSQNYLLNLIFKEEFLLETKYDMIGIPTLNTNVLLTICENSLNQIGSMLPKILYDNINIFREGYFSSQIMGYNEGSDLLRQTLIKYYENEQSNIIPSEWFNLTEEKIKEKRSNDIYDDNFNTLGDIFNFNENNDSFLDLNFDDIFYCYRQFI